MDRHRLRRPRLTAAAGKAHALQVAPSGDLAKLNLALRETETALISEAGLPNRPWYRHTIYAPGEFTGYAAVVIPGVNEGNDAKDANRATQQLAVLTQALERATHTLNQRAELECSRLARGDHVRRWQARGVTPKEPTGQQQPQRANMSIQPLWQADYHSRSQSFSEISKLLVD